VYSPSGTSGRANAEGIPTNPEVPHGTFDLAKPVNIPTGAIMNWIIAKMKGREKTVA
jgi:hypothetical protein